MAYTEEITSAPYTKTAHIANGCLMVFFGFVVFLCVLKCCCSKREEFSSDLQRQSTEKRPEQPSTTPADQQDHSMVVIMPGDRTPTCLAMPVMSSPQHTDEV
ncbi:hypothetical protein A4A49_02898 [Nicotiana attenuata]|uniref:Uncharacterized protein n=1 Tax=Nicotiana attenuata TaxID=49451 RepID=A0A314L3W3_NICAT|nr:hypothetical protein A4A49_02898 [Nicotiana attenuata]